MKLATTIIGSSLAFAIAGCVPVYEEPRPLPPPVVVVPGPGPYPGGPGPYPGGPGPYPGGPGPGPARCNASAAGWAVGERASPRVIERATYESGARSARVVGPGEMVTMDFRGDRLSIYTDGVGRIRDVRCG
jgi:hypothetical protein